MRSLTHGERTEKIANRATTARPALPPRSMLPRQDRTVPGVVEVGHPLVDAAHQAVLLPEAGAQPAEGADIQYLRLGERTLPREHDAEVRGQPGRQLVFPSERRIAKRQGLAVGGFGLRQASLALLSRGSSGIACEAAPKKCARPCHG